MYRQLLALAPTLATLAFVVACGSGGGGDNNSNSVETNLTATINDANQTVSQYAASADPADDAAGYHTQLGDHIDHMSDLRDRIDSHCRDIPNCPAAGGFTGDWNGQCWSDGHMMDGSQMNRLHESILSARHELDDYWNACGQIFHSGTCDTRWQNHTGVMHDIFEQMRGDCDDWWSHEGNHQGDGHWGDCDMHR